MADKSFAKKFNLVGSGKPDTTSQKTKTVVRTLCQRNKAINQKGKEYIKGELRLFGGCPSPGEPGSEKFFHFI